MLEKKLGGGCGESVRQLTHLLAELATLPGHQSEQAIKCLLRRLCSILGAESASWMAMKKLKSYPHRVKPEDYQVMLDTLGGWVPLVAVYTSEKKNLKSVLGRWLKFARIEGVDLLSRAVISGEERTSVYIREDVATEEEWRESWYSQKFLAHYGVGDRMIAMFSLDQDSESCILLDRALGDEPFGQKEKELMEVINAGVAGLHRKLFLEYGVLRAESPLSKRERETYQYLLTDMSEGQIAEEMSLSVHTIHDYAQRLYKKFDVRGRLGLMALLLSAR